jgi:beta-phosphoglucomutase-like phosphatase (HAD superfamily)
MWRPDKLGLPDRVRACLFDLDGVLTDTASVHRKAWKQMFDEYLRQHAERTGEPFRPFDIDADYLTYVDGKKREDGVRSFLASRGIHLSEGGAAEAGLGRAVVSSSANTREVLEVTGLDKLVEHRVDGVTMREEHIAGKPAPDSFLRAAQLLGVIPAEAAVFEDALSGVAAGRAGNFGVVIGVDRVGQSKDLLRNGADVVVTDLAELLSA